MSSRNSSDGPSSVDPSKIEVKSANEGNQKPDESRDALSRMTDDPEVLLIALWRSPERQHFLGSLDRQTNRFRNMPIGSSAEAVAYINDASGQTVDWYFACAEYETPDNRKTENVAGAWAFWLDIDCGQQKASDGKGYATTAEAIEALDTFCRKTEFPGPTLIVDSGGGLHLYWVLDSFLQRPDWKEYAVKLKAVASALGFLADPSRTSDIASVLRVPGTLNHKYSPPRPVRILEHSDQHIVADKMLQAIDRAFEHCCVKKTEPTVKRSGSATEQTSANYGPPDLARLESALTVLDPDCEEGTWKLQRIAPFARAAAANPTLADGLYDLAHAWSSGALRGKPAKAWTTPGTTNGLTGEEVFDSVWERFLTEEHTGQQTTLGTLFYDARQAGWRDTDEEFEILNAGEAGEPTQTADGALSPMAFAQSRFALVNLTGKLCVIDREGLAFDPRHGTAPQLALSNRSDGILIITRALRAEFPDEDVSDVAKQFFTEPSTTCYSGIAFAPTGSTGKKLNLWLGPTIKPRKGTWRRIRQFLFEVICNHDAEAYDYLMKYLAHALQRPGEKPGVMVIMIGRPGTGKGTVGVILRNIWRATYLQVHRMNEVTGTFNASLERAYIVYLDEAVFVGDRHSTEALKSIVTEPTLMINEKHQPSRQIESYHRLVAATNARHFKHTDTDDRRDFVLQVSEERKGDHDYWRALNQEIEQGGVEAMVHDLLAIDLSGFNVRAKPQTAALLDQKLLSLDPVSAWWHDCLQRGEVTDGSEWPEFIATENAIAAIKDMAGRQLSKPPTGRQVNEAFRKFCPSATQDQQQTNFGRHRGLALPDLETARAEFEEYIGGPIPW